MRRELCPRGGSALLVVFFVLGGCVVEEGSARSPRESRPSAHGGEGGEAEAAGSPPAPGRSGSTTRGRARRAAWDEEGATASAKPPKKKTASGHKTPVDLVGVSRKPGGRRVKARTQPVRTSGKLSRVAIRKVIGKGRSAVHACYKKALARDPKASGRISVDFVVGVKGKVRVVSIPRSTIKDTKLLACVKKAIKAFVFPAPKGGVVRIRYPFIFRPGNP